MNTLIKSFKGSKPSKIILAAEKGDNWNTDIYVRPYPRNKLSSWINEMQDGEDSGSESVTTFFDSMAKFVGLCLCNENGELLADDSKETIDFLMSFEDDQILLDLYLEASKASGLGKIADGLLSALNGEATEADEVKPNRKARRRKGK